MRRKTLLSLLLLSIAQDALAYFDPGTGSMIVQGLIAGLAMVVVFFGQLKDAVLRFLRLKQPQEQPEDPAVDADAAASRDED